MDDSKRKGVANALVDEIGMEPIIYQKDGCKILHLWKNQKYTYKMGNICLVSTAVGKDLGRYSGPKAEHELTV